MWANKRVTAFHHGDEDQTNFVEGEKEKKMFKQRSCFFWKGGHNSKTLIDEIVVDKTFSSFFFEVFLFLFLLPITQSSRMHKMQMFGLFLTRWQSVKKSLKNKKKVLQSRSEIEKE